jgi:hypothetical protein
MSVSQNLTVSWKNVPTRTITAGGVEFAYRELGTNNPGTPVVFLVHLAAVLDNWDPRVVDGFAAAHHVITFDNRFEPSEPRGNILAARLRHVREARCYQVQPQFGGWLPTQPCRVMVESTNPSISP